MTRHQETRQLPYTAAQMYDLVADVARYPEFLPWTSGARIRSRTPDAEGREVMEADLIVSFKVFREKFGSRVVLDPASRRIDTQYIDGPFKFMRSHWLFRDLDGGGCEVDFFVEFEFRNALLQSLIGVVFNEAMTRIVRAFEGRAKALYG